MKYMPLSEVADFNPRMPRTIADQDDRPVSFLPMSNLSEEGTYQPIEGRTLGELKKGYTFFESGDVLVAKITPCMENGKAAFISELPHGLGFGSTEFHVVRANTEKLDGKYLFYMLWREHFRNRAAESMRGGAGQQRVPVGFVERYEVPIPFPSDPKKSVKEQQRIAAILDEADGLRRKHLVAARVAGEMLKGMASDIFRKQIHTKKPLHSCSDIVAGSTPSREIAEYWDGDICWVTPKDLGKLEDKHFRETPEKITRKGFESCSTQMLPVGAILFSSRAPIGHVAIVATPMCTNQGFKSFIPDATLNSLYLYFCLKEMVPDIEALGNGATFKEVSKAVISKFEIPIPFPNDLKRSLAEQTRIASLLDEADNLRRLHLQAADTSAQLLASLSQRAFKGEL